MQNFLEYVNCLKRKVNTSKEETIFICIGSKEVIWDSIGPYVGEFLKKSFGEKYVIGDLQNNICSEKDLANYYSKLSNKFIVAIDSALAKEELQGQIFVTRKPIIMGLGINQNKGMIGNIGIKAGVKKGENNKKYIIEFSKNIADGIYYCYNSIGEWDFLR